MHISGEHNTEIEVIFNPLTIHESLKILRLDLTATVTVTAPHFTDYGLLFA